MSTNAPIQLTRDCEAIQIPSGTTISLDKGTEVIITQSLGGSYTVAIPAGLAKIAGSDADALGLETETKEAPSVDSGEAATEDDVWDQLKTCYDPEIPVNIVDLGLVYDCRLVDAEEGSGKRALVKMTLTAPGCGMGPAIAAEAEGKIMSLNGVDEAAVELVWEPAWNQEMISEEGRMKLGMV